VKDPLLTVASSVFAEGSVSGIFKLQELTAF